MKKSSRTTNVRIPKNQKSQKKFRTDVRTDVQTYVRTYVPTYGRMYGCTDVRVQWWQYPIQSKLLRVKTVKNSSINNNNNNNFLCSAFTRCPVAPLYRCSLRCVTHSYWNSFLFILSVLVNGNFLKCPLYFTVSSSVGRLSGSEFQSCSPKAKVLRPNFEANYTWLG